MARARRLRRGIYLLPTLFTTGNLFCGFSAIIQASRGDFWLAGALIIAAALLDGLDGRIARLTGSTSDFGLQFDSLADIVSFGVAPAVLAYYWGLTAMGRSGWLIAFLFVVCAAMRLARFNIRASASDKRFFAGLPSPPAAGAIATLAFVVPEPALPRWATGLFAGLVLTAGLLMVSRFRYRSFKDFDLRNRRSYVQVLPIAALIVGLVAVPEVLLVLAAWYLGSGPAAYAWSLLRRRGDRPVAPAPEVVDGPVLR